MFVLYSVQVHTYFAESIIYKCEVELTSSNDCFSLHKESKLDSCVLPDPLNEVLWNILCQYLIKRFVLMHRHEVSKLLLFRQFWHCLTFQYFIFTNLIILHGHRVRGFLCISVCYSVKKQKFFRKCEI